MKRHVFKATKMGWDKEADGVWFDAEAYSKEEAEAQFNPTQKEALKNDHWVPYTAYEYDGETYHDIQYKGIFDEDDMPGQN